MMYRMDVIGRTATWEWQRKRWLVLERDDFTCQYCGQRAPNVVLEVDHRIAVVDDGTDDLDNLVTACRSCNQGKEYSRWTTSPRRGITRVLSGRPERSDSLAGRVRDLYRQDPSITAAVVARETGCNPNTARITLRRVRRRAT